MKARSMFEGEGSLVIGVALKRSKVVGLVVFSYIIVSTLHQFVVAIVHIHLPIIVIVELTPVLVHVTEQKPPLPNFNCPNYLLDFSFLLLPTSGLLTLSLIFRKRFLLVFPL